MNIVSLVPGILVICHSGADTIYNIFDMLHIIYLLIYLPVLGEGDCLTTGGKQCVFPFRYQEVSYTACTWRDNHKTQGVPWCSLQGDRAGVL